MTFTVPCPCSLLDPSRPGRYTAVPVGDFVLAHHPVLALIEVPELDGIHFRVMSEAVGVYFF